jgi:hypothetical protein
VRIEKVIYSSKETDTWFCITVPNTSDTIPN